jgi:L-threonylcarbamoyladenylate synthase
MPTRPYYSIINNSNIKHIANLLKNDGVIIYPTETVWAIGCNAMSKKAIDKIYSIKKRTQKKPLISLISTYSNINKYVDIKQGNTETIGVPDPNYPPTVIYSNCKDSLKHLANPSNEIALRVTPMNELKKIIDEINAPLISTSANVSGQENPIEFKNIHESILNSVDLILNFDANLSGVPSKILKINIKGEIEYIRR